MDHKPRKNKGDKAKKTFELYGKNTPKGVRKKENDLEMRISGGGGNNASGLEGDESKDATKKKGSSKNKNKK